MQLVKCGSLGVLAFLLLAGGTGHLQRLSADDEPKPETPPAPVKEVFDQYLKALTAKDLKATTVLADVPWLDRDRELVRDRAQLDKAVERVATQLPPGKGKRKVEFLSYSKLRHRTREEAERKLLDEVLGGDGWLVSVGADGFPLSERMILIRVKDGKAAVVAGPLKLNQLSPHNRIPEVVERLLNKAEAFELYSLDPERRVGKDGKVVEVKDDFHGWQVLGKTDVMEAAQRKRLTDALRLGAEDNFGMAAACFIPRHGVRLKGGGKTVDLVICFQCLSVEVFVDGEKQKGFLTTGEPQKEFDQALKAAGIKLAKPAKK
jgi:hypothetical protein